MTRKFEIQRARTASKPSGFLAVLVFLLFSFTSHAFAAPSHSPLPDPIGGFPLNHACGTAVDSKGDIYVSNAGGSKVEVFDPSGSHLTSIADANEPCGLAVDSTGRLYVSEQALGKVVRYVPDVYPFSGTPTYGAPTTINASGNARGIAVDPSDDSLYVAEGNRVSMYKSDGTLFTTNESQVRVFSGSPSGGTYTLSFKGSKTEPPLPYNAPATGIGSIQEALEKLPTIGAGNVTVSGSLGERKITFIGALAATNVPQLVVDPSGLVGGSAEIETRIEGSDGHIGGFTDATGVASYTHQNPVTVFMRRYISVADAGTDEIKVFLGYFDFAPGGFLSGTLEPLQTIDGSETPAGELGLASTGAYLGVDRTNGHLYSYDATHAVLDEFEATGRYFTRIANPAFADAESTAIAIDRSGGAHDGTVYVTAGASSGAKLLAFGPVDAPSRASLGEPPSHKFNSACGTVVDSEGDLYVAGESIIKVYDPVGNQLTSINDPEHPCYLAVDSKGNLYAADFGNQGNTGDEKIVLYEPQAYPPQSGTIYTEKTPPVEKLQNPQGVAVDPSNDHLFVAHLGSPVIEYDSAKKGSGILKSNFCGVGGAAGIDVYGGNEDVYIVSENVIRVCNPTGTKVLARIDGSGSPGGPFSGGGLIGAGLAVDQSNGHVLLAAMKSGRSAVEEYDASGAFVAEFGSFQGTIVPGPDIAVDNSGGPANGNLYVAYREDLTAFGPLKYGVPPVAITGTAGGIGGGNATLNGSVDPRGFDVTECKFEYLTDAAYEENEENEVEPFTGAEEEPCAETTAEIGHGTGPVPVHVDITGIDPETTRYDFCLIAKNKFGESECKARLFGPPVITTKTVQPILYREATLRAKLDPSGLLTKYHFEYLTDAEYLENGETFTGAQSTPMQTLPATGGPTDIEAFLVGLEEGTEYDFRLVAGNEAATVPGPEQTLLTLARHPALECPNATLRLENNSSNLPDCRAYELVTPADTRGASPHAEGPGGLSMSNNWLVNPLTGESLAFFLTATLPGTEGNGLLDAFRATRREGGWGSSDLFSPSSVQMGDTNGDEQHGVSPDQLYSFWEFGGATPPGALPLSQYLRTPEGSPEPSPNCAVEVEPEGRFELIGCGSLGKDPEALGKYISAGASHVIFTTETTSANTAVQLEPNAPPSPIGAVYDRSPGGPTHVVSLLPGEVTPTSSATFQGATEDGSSVVFAINGSLYLRRNDAETVKVADAGSFAGISEDGRRVFYESGGGVHVFDTEGPSTTDIASSAKFVNVSADGFHAYFTAEELGKHNLYMWDGGAAQLVAVLDTKDLHQGGQKRFPGTTPFLDSVALDSWTAQCVNPGASTGIPGRAACPSRTTPDGRFLVFQSHADLTPPYQGQGHSEVYRYDAGDAGLLCVSCDPGGAPATAEADLQSFFVAAATQGTTLIPGVTDNGNEVFFQTSAALLPEDANSVLDVYEWQAQGKGGCKRVAGCLALISSGQGDNPSYIYSMTPNGHDVFFTTLEKLVGADITGSPSIYDARVEGGFPNEIGSEPCHGDACQGEGTPAPSRSTVRSDVPNPGNGEQPKARHCPKGRRAVKRNGKTHCTRAHHKKHRRAKAKGRAPR